MRMRTLLLGGAVSLLMAGSAHAQYVVDSFSQNVVPGTPSSAQPNLDLSYTFLAGDIAAHGNELTFNSYDFEVPATIGSAIQVNITLNGAPLVAPFFFPAGTSFSTADFGPFPFGTVSAGDKLDILLGATSDSYNGTPIGVSYTLALAPEPASVATLGLIAAGTLMRRRSR
jgi:hypothetical protein